MSVLTPTLLQPGTWQADPARSAVGDAARYPSIALTGKIRRSALRDAGRLLVADEVGFALDVVLAR